MNAVAECENAMLQFDSNTKMSVCIVNLCKVNIYCVSKLQVRTVSWKLQVRSTHLRHNNDGSKSQEKIYVKGASYIQAENRYGNATDC